MELGYDVPNEVRIKVSDGKMTIITYWVKDDGDKEEKDEQNDFRLG